MKRPKKSKLPPRYISREKLPKKLGGADVIRALPMHHAKCDRLVEKKALDQFDAKTDLYLVVNESALEGLYPDTRAFRDKKDAIRYARAGQRQRRPPRAARHRADARGRDGERLVSDQDERAKLRAENAMLRTHIAQTDVQLSETARKMVELSAQQVAFSEQSLKNFAKTIESNEMLRAALVEAIGIAEVFLGPSAPWNAGHRARLAELRKCAERQVEITS